MTDKECYEIAVKYSGGEDGLMKLSEMIHIVGVDQTVKLIAATYLDQGVVVPDQFRNWMKQAFRYLASQNNKN